MADTIASEAGPILVHPIYHASIVLGFGGLTVLVDPTGGAERYRDFPPADLVLLTHEHSDHVDLPTLQGVVGEKTAIWGPAVAVDALGREFGERSVLIRAGETSPFGTLTVTAIPAHNLTPERLKFHPPGRGIGYVLSFGERRVYVAGDTEGTPDMLGLTGIDLAFLPMNLPYTMTGPEAAAAVRTFRPRVVYPFHYLGGDENEVFARELAGEAGIEVRLRDWYREDAGSPQ